MPIYSPTGFLDVTNATLRTSNIEAENFKLNGGNIYVSTDFTVAPTLQLITNGGSVTSNTVQFSNVTTGLVADSNIVVTGNVTAGYLHGDASNVTAVPAAQVTGTLVVANGGTGTTTSTGTGSVVLSDAPTFTGDVTFDTDTLFVDSVNDRVGVGTTSPIGTLSIVRDTVVAGPSTYQRGMFYKDGKLQITPPDLYNGYPLDGDFLTTSRYETDGSTDYTGAALGVAYDTVTGSKSALYFKTAVSGSSLTEKMRITGDGNVGIGTTSPDRKLHVKYDTGSWDNTTGAAVIIEDPGSIGAGITLKPTGSGVTNGTNGWALYAGSTSGGVGDGNIGFWAHGTNKAPFRVHRNGNIILLDSPSTGEVIVGDTSTTYNPANMDTPVTSTPTNPILHVNGSIQLKSDNDAIVIGNGNATFLKDEELHFGWGGGWYMTDGTLLRVVNNKKIYSTGAARFGLQLLLDAYGDENSTNCLFIGTNTSSQNLRIGCNSTGNYCWLQSHAGKPLRLNPAGNVVQYGTGNAVLSDDRIKTNEVYIENATDTLLKLKPQIYDKKLIWNISKLGETSNVNVVRESGLITQDVWYDAPELRHLVNLGEGAEPGEDKPVTDNDPTNDPDYSSWGDNVSLLDYMGLIPYIIKSNQEIYTALQAEKVNVTTLESQLNSVLTRLDALENA